LLPVFFLRDSGQALSFDIHDKVLIAFPVNDHMVSGYALLEGDSESGFVSGRCSELIHIVVFLGTISGGSAVILKKQASQSKAGEGVQNEGNGFHGCFSFFCVCLFCSGSLSLKGADTSVSM
jgi:hypothetical protein